MSGLVRPVTDERDGLLAYLANSVMPFGTLSAVLPRPKLGQHQRRAR